MTDTIKTVTKQWLKMGVELEGAWDENYRDVAANVRGAQGKTDASVGSDGARLPGHMGEITTRPHDNLDHLCDDLEKLWPMHINHTCGFHVHTSFTDINTSALADKAFWKFWLDRWEAWGKAHEKQMTNDERTWFWDRLESKSERARRYCKREFLPEEQLRDHDMRYTALNFTAWHKFKTVETRFLPMFKKPELGLLALRELADIFNTYLSVYNFPKVELESELITAGEWVLEEQTMQMPSIEYFEESAPELAAPLVPVGDDIIYRFSKAKGFVSLPGEEYEELQEP